ncbi:MAG: glycosyl transferase family 1, partial [Microcoleus sp. C1-bin4]|nr:glycosyl transferase family 1 [Microcoleus sp. C1-bin4]
IDELGCTFEKTIPVAPEYVEIAKRAIDQNQLPHKHWGWKDPRTTLFWDFWLSLLPEANFICVYRSPWEVVDSLYRRGTDVSLLQNPEMAVKMWIHYNQKVLELYERFPDRCLLANVYPIGNTPELFISAIKDKFNVNLGAIPGDNFEQSLLVNDIAKSHRPSLIEKYFPEALELYELLESQAGNLSSKSPFAIDQVIHFPASPVWPFEDWLKIRLLEKQQKTSYWELKQWQEQFHQAQAKVLELETELGATQVQLAGKESNFQEALAKLLGLETELGQTQGQLAGKESQFQEALTKVLKLEAELGQSQVQIEEKEFRLQEKLAELLRLETAQSQTQETLNETREDLQQSRQENEKLQAEMAAIKSSAWWQVKEKGRQFQRRIGELFPTFVFSLDQPTTWQVCDSNLLIVGWVFHRKKEITAVRARIEDKSFAGVYGIETSDIAPANSNITPGNKFYFTIEVQASAG